MLKFLKKLVYFLLSVFVTLILLYLLREPILKGIGNFLIVEDTEITVDAAFVLSGNVLERCEKGAEIFLQGHAPTIVAIGGNINEAVRAIGIEVNGAQLSQKALISMGVDSSAIKLIERGTSTYEESEEILAYSQVMGFKRVMIISSKYHTRRIQNVFKDKFQEAGIEVIVLGAEPLDYDLDKWWESESAMIFVNNEYVKLIYYWLKY